MNSEEINKRKQQDNSGRNYHFYQPVGQFIEHVDTVNFSMDKDGKFHFENVGQMNKTDAGSSEQSSLQEDKLYKHLHPSIDLKNEGIEIHKAIERLVKNFGVKEICQYLLDMAKAKKILLPEQPSIEYEELKRIGMPHGDGFSLGNFSKYYKRPKI